MKLSKTGFTVITLIIGLYSQASAQQSTSDEQGKFSVEIDPATFAFKGYSIHLRLQPKNSDHLLLGIGTYALDLPDVFVNFSESNRDKGWNIRISQGFSFFGEHHFTEVNQKWFIGSQVGIQQFKIENENISGREKYSNFLAMGYFGYTFKPFNNSLYIKPWAGIGYTSKVSGENTLASLTYEIEPVTMFLTFHVGYTF